MTTVEKNGLSFSYNHAREFKIIYNDIFKKGMYDIVLKNPHPTILDVGAHIGISVIYFKQKFPHAKIYAFEPNPYTLKLLTKNVKQNKLTDVHIIPKAVGDKNSITDFYISKENPKVAWSWDNSMVKNKWYSKENAKTIKVPVITLKNYLKKDIDLLKLDIEGMEERVLKSIKNDLKKVKNIVLEFHGSSTNKENNVHRLINLLEESGFNVKVNQGWKFIPKKKLNDTKDPFWLGIHALSP